MIRRLEAVRLDREAATGRTRPGFVVCEDEEGEEVEVVAKLSAGCDMGATSLATELFAACIAGRLGLPIPEPIIVNLSSAFLASVSGTAWGQLAAQPPRVAYGSLRLPPAFRTWISETPLVGGMGAAAASILLFDSITYNPDRRVENPNCLVRGDDIRIIDHELALSSVPLLGWRPPWEVGAAQNMSRPGAHIFYVPLRQAAIDWAPIAERWQALSDEDLGAYRAFIPAEWSSALGAIDSAIEKIRNARANLDGCIEEVRRLLS